MAYAFEPINIEAMKALKPFADASDQYGSEVNDTRSVTLRITVGELRYARRVWNAGADYKYDDRSKIIAFCAQTAQQVASEYGDRQLRREIVAAINAMLPVYVKPPTG